MFCYLQIYYFCLAHSCMYMYSLSLKVITISSLKLNLLLISIFIIHCYIMRTRTRGAFALALSSLCSVLHLVSNSVAKMFAPCRHRANSRAHHHHSRHTVANVSRDGTSTCSWMYRHLQTSFPLQNYYTQLYSQILSSDSSCLRGGGGGL